MEMIIFDTQQELDAYAAELFVGIVKRNQMQY